MIPMQDLKNRFAVLPIKNTNTFLNMREWCLACIILQKYLFFLFTKRKN